MRKVSLLLGVVLFWVQVFAQQRIITGKVTDANGAPVANASVVIKGSTAGTTTKPDGSYSIGVTDKARYLIISSIGQADQEITIGNKGIINAILQPADKSLSEVVVVGYGTQKKSNLTSAVGRVSGDKLADVPLSSPDQMLQGAVAGLQSVTFSGQPGANQQIRIRGVGSFFASSQPLFIVDGIQINSGDLSRETTTTNVLASMNPDDIESISVLKDAGATAIYGSRGSNGVIIITTKRGKAGRTQFRASGEVGQNRHGDIPAIGMPLRSKDWLTLFKESILNTGASQATADATAANYGDGTVDTDWLDLLTRAGTQQQYNISASGGDEKTKIYISGGYFKQQANVIGSDLTRYTSVINLDHTVSKKLRFSLNLSPSYTKQNTPLSNSSAFSNPVMEFDFLRPLQNPYNADGSLNINTAAKDFSSTYNPLYIIQNDIHSTNNVSGNAKAEAKYNILNNLSFTSGIGFQYIALEEYYYNNPFHGDGKAANGRGYAYDTRYSLYDFTNQLDYKANLTKNGNLLLTAKAGYEALQSKSYFVSAQSQNFPTPTLTDAIVASTPTIASNSGSDYSFASEFANANISFKGKYILEGNFRRDGSSRFSLNRQHANFPAISAGWNISKEDFMNTVKFVSNLKLRASYGSSGNAEIGNYTWRQTLGYGLNYNNQPGGGFNNIGNDQLTWEASKQTDVGVEGSFLNNRLGFTLDLYKKVIDKLIFPVPTSQTIGFSTIQSNVGAMQNSGVELTINATPVATKDFSWDISFNITHNKNKMTKLPPGQTQVLNGQFILKNGYDFYTFFMRQWAGVDPANGDPLWYLDSSKKTTTNNYNLAQRSITNKTATPKYYGGFSNKFTFKSLSLSGDFYYNYGNYVQDQWAAYFYDEVNPSYGKYTYNLQRWQKPGDITNVPKPVYGATNFSSSASTRFLFKGDYIRLRNIQLGYSAPHSLAEKLHLTAMNFYVRGTNLWTKRYDKNIPFDPEQNVNSQSNLNIFYNKAVTVGLNIGF
jgi:TonB-dependent starch-binding outer membrane protein SusC